MGHVNQIIDDGIRMDGIIDDDVHYLRTEDRHERGVLERS